MKKFEGLLPIASFFWMNQDWYTAVCEAILHTNDTTSYSTELWEDIIHHQTGHFPKNKDDPLWDEVLVKNQTLRHFSRLKQLGFFNQKAP